MIRLETIPAGSSDSVPAKPEPSKSKPPTSKPSAPPPSETRDLEPTGELDAQEFDFRDDKNESDASAAARSGQFKKMRRDAFRKMLGRKKK